MNEGDTIEWIKPSLLDGVIGEVRLLDVLVPGRAIARMWVTERGLRLEYVPEVPKKQ